VVVLCAVALVACPGGDGTDTVQDVARVPATVADVQRRVFSFPDAAAFGRPGFSMELTFGDFDGDGDSNPQTGLFALDAAQGIATLQASCDLLITTSTFDETVLPGLQPGQTLHFEPCAVAPSDGSLRVENAQTGAVSISDPPAVARQVLGQIGIPEFGFCLIFHGNDGVDYILGKEGPGVSLDDVLVDGARLTLDLIPLPDVASVCLIGTVATVIAVIDVVLP
jgi:hypothetical protein